MLPTHLKLLCLYFPARNDTLFNYKSCTNAYEGVVVITVLDVSAKILTSAQLLRSLCDSQWNHAGLISLEFTWFWTLNEITFRVSWNQTRNQTRNQLECGRRNQPWRPLLFLHFDAVQSSTLVQYGDHFDSLVWLKFIHSITGFYNITVGHCSTFQLMFVICSWCVICVAVTKGLTVFLDCASDGDLGLPRSYMRVMSCCT